MLHVLVCAIACMSLPILLQVAFMFLVNDKIHTEPIWSAFFAAAAELALRRHVPPTRPGPPELFERIPTHTAELRANCWPHAGPIVPIRVTPRRNYQGAQHIAAVQRTQMCNMQRSA
jgi:hypothetical protein